MFFGRCQPPDPTDPLLLVLTSNRNPTIEKPTRTVHGQGLPDPRQAEIRLFRPNPRALVLAHR
jgi:hypothetical protein